MCIILLKVILKKKNIKRKIQSIYFQNRWIWFQNIDYKFIVSLKTLGCGLNGLEIYTYNLES